MGSIEGYLQKAGTGRLIVIDVVHRQAGHRQIRVLIDREAEVGVRDDGRIVDRVDQDVDRLRSGVRNAIGDDVGDLREGAAVDVVVGVQRERDGAVGGDGDLALAVYDGGLPCVVDRVITIDHEGLDRERVVIRVARIREHVQVGITFFGGRQRLILRNRNVIDRNRQGAVGRRARGAVGKDVADDRDDADVVQRATDEARTRRVGEGAVGVDLDRTLVVREGSRIAGVVVRGIAEDREGRDTQGVEVDIRVVRGDAAVQRDAGTDRVGVVGGDRQVIHRRDGDSQGRGGGEVAVILKRIGDDRNSAVPVGDRGEGERAVGVEGEFALTGDGDRGASRVDRGTAGDRVADDRQSGVRFAAGDFDVGVVGQDAARDGGNRIFRAGGRIVDADGRVVDRGDGDRERGGGRRIGRAVILDRISDRRSRAVPIRDRSVDIRAIGLDRERGDVGARAGGAQGVVGAVERNVGHLTGRARGHRDVRAVTDANRRHRERVVFRVRVVEEQVAGSSTVFGRGSGVGIGDRGVVDRRNGQGKSTGVGQGGGSADGNLVGDDVVGADGTVPVRDGRERVRTVGGDGERALVRDDDRRRGGRVGQVVLDGRGLRADGEGLHAQRVAVRIRIIDQQAVRVVLDDRGLFRAAGGIGGDGRRVVDVDLQRARGRGADRITLGEVGNSERAGEGVDRREREVTIGVDLQVALVGDGVRLAHGVDRVAAVDREAQDRGGRSARVVIHRTGRRIVEQLVVDGGVLADVERAVGERRRAEQVAVGGAVAEDEVSDFTRAVFERPVATEFGGAGLVDRGGDVGGRELGKGIDERLTGGASGDIATVQQDVRVRGEGAGNGLQVSRTREERVGGIRAATEDQLAVRTVADDRHGTDVGQFGQGLRDLGQTILGRIQTDDQRGRVGLRDELLPALDRCIHKHHNAFRRFGGRARSIGGGLSGRQKLRGVVQGLLRFGELLFRRKFLGINLLDFAALGQDAELGGGHEEATVEHVARFEGAEPKLRPFQTAKSPGDVLEGKLFVWHESI